MAPLVRTVGKGCALGLWAGAAGGAIAGLVEALAAWKPAAQYLPGMGGRLRLLAFLCALEGGAGALAGAATGGLAAFLWFGSDLGGTAAGVWRRGGSGLFAWSVTAVA